MVCWLPLLQVSLLSVAVVSVQTLKKQKHKQETSKKEVAKDFSGESLLNRKGSNMSHGRLPRTDNDDIIERLMSSLVANEKYLQKIDNIDFRLNRLDIEMHEKTDGIMKLLTNVSNVVQNDHMIISMDNIGLMEIQTDVQEVKSILENRQPPPKSESDNYSGLVNGLNSMQTQLTAIGAGVENIMGVLSEVKNRQNSKATFRSGSYAPPIDSSTLITEFRRTLDESKKKCDCSKDGRVDRSERYPTDCHEIHMQGFNMSGIYKIKPEYMEPFYVLCDLTTAGGGWTVLQNRFDGTQDFYKSWSDYKNGFGNLAGEFWLGLEKINYLTNQKLYELRVEMETQRGVEAYAAYSVFTVGPEHEGFRISTLGTYYGTAGDSLTYHAGQKFSTLDADNDEWKDGACAVEHGGAWWYKECDKSNLNGKYTTDSDENRGQGIYWISFKGTKHPLVKTKMMIRPLPATRPNYLAEKSRTTKYGTSHKLYI